MSQGRVTEILGAPSGVWPDGTWVYSSKLSWPKVYVYFDDQMRLSSYDCDN